MSIFAFPYILSTSSLTSGYGLQMATYGGFAPGSYNAWALNLITDVFCTPGVSRGMNVTAPGGMAVSLGVDPVALDGVVVLPNGAWMRIDQAITYTVPANGGSGTRTDAIVAFLDPTGVANPEFSITYNANWAGGFTGNTNNQWVIAQINVAVGAVSIAANNITMNPNTAHFGNPTQLTAADGIGIRVIDSSATSQTILQSTIGTPSYRALVLQAIDSAGGGHNFLFDQNGNAAIPNNIYFGSGVNGVLPNLSWDSGNKIVGIWAPQSGAQINGALVLCWNGSQQVNLFGFGNQVGASSYVDINGVMHLRPNGPSGGSGNDTLQISSFSNPAHYVVTGHELTGLYMFDGFQSGFVFRGLNSNANVMTYNTNAGAASAQRIFTGTVTPTNATNGDIWINA